MADAYAESEEGKERAALDRAIERGDLNEFEQILTTLDPGYIMEYIEDSLKYGHAHIADYLMSLDIVDYAEIMKNDCEDVDEGVLNYCISKGYISDCYTTDPLYCAIMCGFKGQAKGLVESGRHNVESIPAAIAEAINEDSTSILEMLYELELLTPTNILASKKFIYVDEENGDF